MLRLKRLGEVLGATLGILTGSGLELCTLEKRWRNNTPQISSIPAGRYILKRHDSEKFHNTFELTGVPGRSEILIHAGNTILDTHGCILVGIRFGMLGAEAAVLESRAAHRALMAALAGLDDIPLEIVPA